MLSRVGVTRDIKGKGKSQEVTEERPTPRTRGFAKPDESPAMAIFADYWLLCFYMSVLGTRLKMSPVRQHVL